MTAGLQPRRHGGSSHKVLYGKEYSGEIAEMGEQVRSIQRARRMVAGIAATAEAELTTRLRLVPRLPAAVGLARGLGARG
eukprot:6840435-Pyramimonas_sp.AAC.1